VTPAICVSCTLLVGFLCASPSQAAGQTGPTQTADQQTADQQKADQQEAKDQDKSKAKKKDQAKAKDAQKAEDKHGFVWKDRPSLRFGKNFRMDFRLKIQVDFLSTPDPTVVDEPALDMNRRRFGIKGSVLQGLEYEVEHDLRSDGEWRDVYLNVAYLPYAQAQGGKFKIPFSYEELTGPTDLDFIYRTRVVDALACGRGVGAMAHGKVLKKAITYQVGYFQDDGDNAPSLEPTYPNEPLPADARGPALAGRVAVAPFRAAGTKGLLKTLEVGFSAVSTDDVPEGPNHLKGQSITGYHFFPRQYLTSGKRFRQGFEFVWTPGALGVKAEYLTSTETRVGVGVGTPEQLDNTLPDLVGSGWYVSGTWVVTGEKKDGGIEPRKPLFRGGFGAIEVGARYETLRFQSATADGPASTSRRSPTVLPNAEQAFTFGVSWYANKWIKVQLNGVHEQFDDPQRSPMPDRPGFWSTVCRLQFVL